MTIHPADLAAAQADASKRAAILIAAIQATLNTLKIETGPKK